MEDRIQKAVELFKSGYNCSQSVVAAFADMYGFTQEQALRMGASFGGGIGQCVKRVELPAACFWWRAWKPALRKRQTGKEKLPIMRWCKNWRLNLRSVTAR